MSYPGSGYPAHHDPLTSASSSRCTYIPAPTHTVHKVANSAALRKSHFTLDPSLIAPLPAARHEHGHVPRQPYAGPSRPIAIPASELPGHDDAGATSPPSSSSSTSSSASLSRANSRGRSRRIKTIRSSASSAERDGSLLAARSHFTRRDSAEVEREHDAHPAVVRVRSVGADHDEDEDEDEGEDGPAEFVKPSSPARVNAIAAALDQALQAEVLRQLLPIIGRLPRSTPQEDDPSAAVDDDGVSTYLRSAPDSALPSVLYSRSRLPRLDTSSRELWKALHGFRPVVADYAEGFVPTASSSVALRGQPTALPAGHPTVALDDTSDSPTCPFATSSARHEEALDSVRRAFNWSSLALPPHTAGDWYGVVFRSVKRSAASASPADLLDLQARWDALYAADALAHEEAVDAGGLIMYWYGAPSATTGANLATCVWTSREDALAASALPLHKQAVKYADGAYETYELARYRIVKRVGEAELRLEGW